MTFRMVAEALTSKLGAMRPGAWGNARFLTVGSTVLCRQRFARA